MFNSERYFATVRRAILIPCTNNSFTISSSDRGLDGFSLWIISLSMSFTLVLETSTPLEV